MQGIFAEGFYKWKDARGNIQYGDKPPKNIKVEKFKAPAITVLESYGRQWLPSTTPLTGNNSSRSINKKTQPPTNNAVYTKFSFIAPKNNQVMKSNFNGAVSAMLSLKPPLKKGHKITFSLNGKEIAKSTSRTQNFSNLKRGNHSISANVLDKYGNVVMTANAVSFKVMRPSSKKRYDPLDPKCARGNCRPAN